MVDSTPTTSSLTPPGAFASIAGTARKRLMLEPSWTHGRPAVHWGMGLRPCVSTAYN